MDFGTLTQHHLSFLILLLFHDFFSDSFDYFFSDNLNFEKLPIFVCAKKPKTQWASVSLAQTAVYSVVSKLLSRVIVWSFQKIVRNCRKSAIVFSKKNFSKRFKDVKKNKEALLNQVHRKLDFVNLKINRSILISGFLNDSLQFISTLVCQSW